MDKQDKESRQMPRSKTLAQLARLQEEFYIDDGDGAESSPCPSISIDNFLFDDVDNDPTFDPLLDNCQALVYMKWMEGNITKLGGERRIVEIDEAKFGKRKYNRGRFVNVDWVFVVIERGTKRAFLVPVEDPDTGANTQSVERLLCDVRAGIARYGTRKKYFGGYLGMYKEQHSAI